ncbi:hypothetical protein R50073_31010 [Maricurvus nonylphenolicus]|uniref:AraC family transcriptional regulator n=1 Tax=Maricurvus nonylphenolicus TaxID=1008307 RepID=UPI0036F2CB32
MDNNESFVGIMAESLMSFLPEIDDAVREKVHQGEIDVEVQAALFREYARYSGKPSWGIDLGMRVSLLEFGFFGYAVSSAPTLRHSLNMLTRYSVVVSAGINYELTEESGRFCVSFIPDEDLADIRTGIAEFAFANLMKQVSPVAFGEVVDVVFGFMGPEPEYVDLLKTCLGGELRFNQDRFSLSLPSRYCDYPSPLYNREIWTLSIQECKRLYSITLYNADKHNLTEAVSHYIDSAFLKNQKGIEREPTTPSSSDIANKLGVSESYLRKQLMSEGHSFRELKEERRKQWCLKLLGEDELSIEAIAAIVGYSDASNFSRACKQWFGYAPKQIKSEYLGK